MTTISIPTQKLNIRGGLYCPHCGEWRGGIVLVKTSIEDEEVHDWVVYCYKCLEPFQVRAVLRVSLEVINEGEK